MERKVSPQALNLLKQVTNLKKSGGSTIKKKKKTAQQLKKLSTNIKQSQGEVIIKEEQSYMITSRRPKQLEANIDPNAALIEPHLMKTVPVLFTSNMTEKESNNKRGFAFELISRNDNTELLNDENDLTNIKSDTETIISQDVSTIQNKIEQCNKEPINKDIERLYPSNNDESRTTHVIRGKRKEITKSNTEENMQIKRIKRIMQQEQHLANIKLNHEKTMAAMKEEHLKEFNYLQLKHLKKIHEEEIKIKKAKLKSIEHHSQQKTNVDPHI